MRRAVAGLGVAAALLAAAAAFPALAGDAQLTSRDVTEVIASMKALAPIVSKHRSSLQQYTRAQPPAAANDDPCRQTKGARALPGYAEAERVVKEHGFRDGEHYCRVSLRIFAACGVVRADREHPEWREDLARRDEQAAQARAQMNRMLAELDDEPALSAEQKRQMRKQLTEMLKDLDRPSGNPLIAMLERVSKADTTVVAPHCAELESVARALAE